MCGIAGIIKLDPGATVEPERLKRMRDIMRHRGPDGEGLHVEGPIGIAHRRLAILDPAGGHQPMTLSDGNTWIVYNGEIYNHPRLRPQIEALGRVYRTKSDTETILHLYEMEGENCVNRLEGMFAFALWDRSRRRLLLARDRLGIKPLYYAVTRDELLFASEIKAILAAGTIKPEFNEAVLPEYLATRYVSGEETFFRGVKELPPGHLMSWCPGEKPRLRKYWSLPSCSNGNGNGNGTGDRQREEMVRGHLTAAAGSHLMSDVPVGLFLSGGIDSTALASLIAPLMKDRLRTFTVAFDDPEANELAYARIAADSVGADHKEVVVKPEEFFDALPRLIWHEDEPIAFSSSVPLYFVSRLAGEQVKVVLTGEGADELFLGYNRYLVTAMNERFGRAFWNVFPETQRATIGRIAARMPAAVQAYTARSFLTLAPGPRELFYDNFSVINETLQKRLLLDPGLLAARDPYATSLRCYQESPGDALDRMGHADMQTYLSRLLMKQDRMSMAASIESRVPFLDNTLVEHVSAIPGRYRLRGMRPKALLRSALHDLVPPSILNRKKMGFPVPLGRWFSGPFWPVVEDLVLGPRAAARRLFEPAALRGLAEEHRSGAADHGEKLWLLANLELWHRIFIEGEVPPPVKGSRHA